MAPVLLTPLQIAAAGSTEFSRLLVASLAVQVIAGVAGLGVPQAVSLHVRFVVTSGPSRLLFKVLPLTALAAAITASAGALIVACVGRTNLPADSILLCALPGALLALVGIALEFLRVAGRASAYLLLTAAAVLVAPSAGTVAIFLGGRLTTYLLVWSASLLLSLPLAIRLVGAEGSRLGSTPIGLGRLIRSGLPLIGSSIFATAVLLSDRLAIQNRISEAAVGQYQISFVLGGIGMQAAAALNIPWLPRITTTDDRARALAKASVPFSFAVTLGIAGTLIAASPYLSLSLGSIGSIQVAEFATLSFVGLTLVQPLYFVAYDAAYAAGATGSIGRIVVGSSLLQTTVIWLFAADFGLTAAVAANVVSQLVQIIRLARASGMPMSTVCRCGIRLAILWPGAVALAIAAILVGRGRTAEMMGVGGLVALAQLVHMRRRINGEIKRSTS